MTGGECSLPVFAPTPSASFEVIGRTPAWAEGWTPGMGPLARETEHAQLAHLVAKYPDLARSLLS